MPLVIPFRSLTDARIEMVGRPDRTAALARMAKARGAPLLRAVNPADGFCEDPDGNDVAIGLFAKLQCSRSDELTGLLVVRERPTATAPSGGAIRGGRPERLFLIEALTVSRSMSQWRPPVQTLLAATAATLIATIHHDPAFRTHVAFRAPDGDPMAEEAAAMIGARAAAGGFAPPPLASIPPHELRFLDGRAASLAARMVLDHMDGEVSPSQPQAPRPNGRTWHRQLTIAFPKAMHHLASEMRLIAEGEVDLGWSMPAVATNDTEEVDVAHVARS